MLMLQETASLTREVEYIRGKEVGGRGCCSRLYERAEWDSFSCVRLAKISGVRFLGEGFRRPGVGRVAS